MTSVAVLGLNGFLGTPTIKALLSEPFISSINTPIKLLTSSDKKPINSSKLEYINIKTTPIKDALRGVDAFINLGNPQFSATQEVIDALVANKVKLYIPSQFGTDLDAVSKDFPDFLSIKTNHSQDARKSGVKTVDVYTGLFIDSDQLFMGAPLSLLGFDKDEKTVEVIGDESTLINPSFLEDIGKVLASLVTQKEYSSIPDQVRTYSDKVTIGDLISHYEKVNNVKLNKNYIKPQDLVKEAKSKYKDFSFKDFLFYLKSFLALGDGKGLIFESNNDREFINPNESLFKWTKYIV